MIKLVLLAAMISFSTAASAYTHLIENRTDKPVLVKIDTKSSYDVNVYLNPNESKEVSTQIRCVNAFEARGPYGRGIKNHDFGLINGCISAHVIINGSFSLGEGHNFSAPTATEAVCGLPGAGVIAPGIIDIIVNGGPETAVPAVEGYALHLAARP